MRILDHAYLSTHATHLMKLQLFCDPSHGWLRVKRSDALQIMGADFKKLTQFSYARAQWLYLEEDYDAGLFLNAATRQGIKVDVEYNHSNRQSRIRQYPALTA